MKNFVTGAQIFSVRRLCADADGLGSTLRALSAMGYTTCQLSGQSRDIPDETVAELLKESSMKCVVTHNSMADFEESFDALVKRHRAWNCGYAGLGAMPAEFRHDIDGFRRFAAKANVIAKKCCDEGLTFVYHNHAFEFCRHDGVLGMDVLFNDFCPEAQFELDTYWVQAGGCNPIEWIRKVSGRMDVVHFKDMSGTDDFNPAQKMVPVGSGNLPWKEIKLACEETAVKFAEVEQDNASDMEDPLSQMQESAENLKRMGFLLG